MQNFYPNARKEMEAYDVIDGILKETGGNKDLYIEKYLEYLENKKREEK